MTADKIDKAPDAELCKAAAAVMGFQPHVKHPGYYWWSGELDCFRYDPVNNLNAAYKLLEKVCLERRGMWATSFWDGFERWVIEFFHHPAGSETWTVSATDKSHGRAIVRACLKALAVKEQK